MKDRPDITPPSETWTSTEPNLDTEIITLKETQPADMRKVRNTHAPMTKDRKGGRVGGRGAEGNSSKETVLRLKNHTLVRRNSEKGTPKQKLEGDITCSPAKKLKLLTITLLLYIYLIFQMRKDIDKGNGIFSK
jgi:hypothetical protein